VRFLKRIDEATQKEERFALKLEPEWWGLSATYYGVRQTGAAAKALSAIATKQKTFNFLKGEAFALAGEFLPKTDETFTGLFLTAANKQAMERVVALINDKGADLENRGMLLVGPPGTGKTLSARITRNVANCTFIWISSRDFYTMGAFGGITGAYDLARECASGPDAPTSVIVFEDIDNWLSEHTLDLLKTELDGVGRSTGIVTIMTTNYPEYLPAALLDRPGRFHDVLRFGLPDETVRRAMLKTWIEGIDDVTLIKAVDATKGYSGAHIRELARFAAIIGEQDALDLSTSVARALDKLKEQRDLITNGLTQGSRYRMEDDLAVKTLLKGRGLDGLLRDLHVASETAAREAAPLVQKTLGDLPVLEAHDPTKTLSLTEAVAAGGVQVDVVVPAVRQADLIEDGATAVDGARELMDCAKTLLGDEKLTPVQRAKVKQAQAKIFSVLISTSKAGRVLSSANEARINQAKGLLQEVLDQLESAPTDTVAEGGVDVMNPPPLVGVLQDTPQTELSATPAVAKGSDVVLVLDEEQVIFEGDPADVKADVTSILRAAIDEQVMLNTGRVH
jgi:hypothetical protein